MSVAEKIKNFNAKEEIEKLKNVGETFYSNYKESNSEKIRLIDCFIVFNAILVVLQIIYLFFNGLDPVNSFLSGVFSCLGFMTLLSKKIIFNIFSLFKTSCEF